MATKELFLFLPNAIYASTCNDFAPCVALHDRRLQLGHREDAGRVTRLGDLHPG